jgi:atypical dual specificity phosphatase
MQTIDINLPVRRSYTRRDATINHIKQTRPDLQRKCTSLSPIDGTQFTPRATEIVPNLYISDLYTATDVSFLMSHCITHRLSVQMEPVEPPYSNFALKMKHIPLADKCDARLWMYLDTAADWIHAALTKEDGRSNVLVHCRWGKSRSVALLAGYLMKYRGMALSDALAFIQTKREISQPNSGFMRQLKAYEEGMKGHRRA